MTRARCRIENVMIASIMGDVSWDGEAQTEAGAWEKIRRPCLGAGPGATVSGWRRSERRMLEQTFGYSMTP
jgi:hypothetical protein